MVAVEGVALELEDCAFPLLNSIEISDDPKVAFADASWALLVGSTVDQGVLDLGDPAVDDVGEGAARAGAGSQLLHHLAVDVVEAVEVQVVVGDDDEAGGEAAGLGVEHRQAGEEGLAATVTAAQELEGALAALRQAELAVDLAALPVDADGEGLETALGNDPGAQTLEDVLDISFADRHGLPRLCRSSSDSTTQGCLTYRLPLGCASMRT